MTSAALPDNAITTTSAAAIKEILVDRAVPCSMLKLGGEAANRIIALRSARSTSSTIRFTRNLCSGSRAGCVVDAGGTPAATEESTIIGGRDAFPHRPTFPIFTCTGENLRTSRRDVSTYGVPVGEAAGAGVPKLKFTAGALSAPGCAAKNGRGA